MLVIRLEVKNSLNRLKMRIICFLGCKCVMKTRFLKFRQDLKQIQLKNLKQNSFYRFCVFQIKGIHKNYQTTLV